MDRYWPLVLRRWVGRASKRCSPTLHTLWQDVNTRAVRTLHPPHPLAGLIIFITTAPLELV